MLCTEYDLRVENALHVVEKASDPDDLVNLIMTEENENWPQEARDAAAEKLIKMWKEGDRNCTLDHLAYVGDYADVPYCTEAETIMIERLIHG
ncbi:hypothetical protein FJY93_02210 [Candidatus Kaiserbacteria bacterium]|nr:hypothetical protein [Candidatus Kaiserbacteria bacterium]